MAWAKKRLLVNGYAGRDVALDTAYRSGGGPTFLMEIGPALMGLPGLVGAATRQSGQRFDPDQEALIDLAQEAKQRGEVTPDEADTLVGWAEEYGLPARIDDKGHPGRGFGRIPHIHIGPIDHIPIK